MVVGPTPNQLHKIIVISCSCITELLVFKLCITSFAWMVFLKKKVLRFLFFIFLSRPKTGESSSDEEAKEVSAASCQERLQPVDSQHPSPHTYRKSLRLSSDQIVSALLSIFFPPLFSIKNVRTFIYILHLNLLNFQEKK